MSMNTLGWPLHSGIFGFGQKTPPGPWRSWAVTSTVLCLSLIASNLRQPFGVFRIAAVHDVEERALDLLGDRPARARTELDAVELADRRDLGRRAGEERFVGDVDLVARDALFDQLQPEVFADREHRVARDA